MPGKASRRSARSASPSGPITSPGRALVRAAETGAGGKTQQRNAMLNRKITLVRRPDGRVRLTDFSINEEPVSDPGDGEVLVRNAYIGLQPAARIRMSEGDSYAPPTALGG